MYVFGHAGLTIAAARSLDRGVDLRWAALLALAPDLLDKPVRYLFPEIVNYNTRGFGHTLLFSLFVLAAALIWTRRPRTAFALWACYAGHFLFDSMWRGENPVILLWPLLGDFPPYVRGNIVSLLTLSNVLCELAGLYAVHRLGLFNRPRLTALLKTGRLA